MTMYPSYSPLFTLGLLADHCPVGSSSPSPSSSPAEEAPPTTTSPQNDDNASAFYFTLQTGKRDTVELRSFLYLDLADHKRHAPSHRRKFSILSKSTSWTCTTDVKSIYDSARTEKPMIVMPPVPVVPTRRRTSKESLRSIPSPKPAPSTTLPDLPITSDPRPLTSAAPPSSSSKKRPASSSLLSPIPRVRRASLRSESISSHDRRRSRMDALACLEGRSRVPNRVPRSSTLRNNFMSFSDDEDEKSTARKSSAPSAAATPAVQIEDLSAFADVEDEVDAIIPNLERNREVADQAKSARPGKPARKRRGTIESWFPLKSFIDFKDDDSSWNWRSFIEIGGVS
ncbi:hypothetical protein J3R83DRAFT_7874 [Lanmaoa asiatica]|nr:hypothetical protein J3R83DRAFT_7874 [Lanmaoa asiatica]